MYESGGSSTVMARARWGARERVRGFFAPRLRSVNWESSMSQSSVRRFPEAGPSRIAFVQSGWHADIVDQSRVAFMKAIRKHGIPANRVEHHGVPGAFEIPLCAKLLARSGRYAAIVAAGFVV